MKKLLEKYWNELEHYKNGGKLAGRRWVTDPNDGDSSFTIWYEIDSCSTWMMKDLLTNPQDRLELIINDDYKLYRKALAEGKTIQINNSNPETWIDIDTDKLANYNPSFLRIKPEEPKFKAGDFIRQTKELGINVSRIYRIKAHISDILYSVEKNIYDVDAINTKEEYFELWKPSHKELCYFTHDTNTKTSAILREFREISKDGFYVDCFGARFIYCEPFINSKPTWFK